MCLAIPGKIVEIRGVVAIVDYGGVRREARIDFVPDVKQGDYVIVHTGFAIEKMDEESAKKSIEAWDEILEGDLE
ncbi:HypC/HybG/HupF family hydrogenase formation chaperone [Candidatus Aciduliprofundum boonei]|uniref:Hydrogenase assembly chaperone hypC/hupF n=1 Tax=Aciduliprofundum boonei (strain DSM 19572 / T469) TaxID=439481 RepID=B5I9N3_ACIB4|nr:HypC/HybG/HupF family hydrogenase formation chaperone [Candidatus Aciduliprofundum boonei]ADD08494.1 hydrogenase assembly chaperone hypC/hupF [Aciduliprofundum boonei T469]EDY36890.1 hydrogenase assembly chaperone HypC/HupF [Aciduliprofundum boonei T469]HII54912.1 HypC/HybG/HupF family hydrogenase formation chaperone [Candidatus Aciduliprofundum boonei]